MVACLSQFMDCFAPLKVNPTLMTGPASFMVTSTWHTVGTMTKEYVGIQPTLKKIEIYGATTFVFNKTGKLIHIRCSYDGSWFVCRMITYEFKKN